MKYKEINLSNSRLKAKVSPCDYERVKQYNWSAYQSKGNAIYAIAFIGGRCVRMHRLIIGNTVPDGLDIDHANLNGLDNRRENLRLATHSQNAANSPKQRGTYSSRYKGVSRRPEGKYNSYITVDGKQYHLGVFEDERDAARAYDEAALANFRDFARTNFRYSDRRRNERYRG